MGGRNIAAKNAVRFASMVVISIVVRNVAVLHSANTADANNTASCAVVQAMHCAHTVNARAAASFVVVPRTVNMVNARMGAESATRKPFACTDA